MSTRNRLTQRKSAKKYDNVDMMSLNNPFEDPDIDKYDLDSPTHFNELPDMRSEWQKDPGAYDEETHFLMPLDDVPSWWGQGPKMASMKAEACLKIAEAIFPDAVDDFVDAQAVDFMDLPDKVVLATLKRLAMYQEEPLKVNALLGKTAAEGEDDASDEDVMQQLDAALAPSAEGGQDMMPAAPMSQDGMPAAPMGGEGMPAAPMMGEDDDMDMGEEGDESMANFDMGEEAELETAKANINPSTEFGNFFTYDGDVEDISFGNTTTASVDLESVFSDEYVNSTQLRKSASVKNSKSSNLKLSEYMGNVVPRKANTLTSLWDASPNVEESFK